MSSVHHDFATSGIMTANPAPGRAIPRNPLRGMERLELAAGASAVMCAVALLVAAAGLLPLLPVLLVTGYCLAGNLLFFALQRSGRNARFHDPDCVFASHLFSISVLLLGCGLIPEDRSAALQLFLLIWAFDLSRLSRRQQAVAASFAVLGMSAILFASWLSGGAHADAGLRRQVLALATTVVYLPGLLAIGHRVRRIHAGQRSQRTALADALVELRSLSERDALTGVSNRRHAQGVLAQEAARQSRSHQPFSVCLLDLDHFKRVNDLHGHATGDAVLVGTAHRLRAMLPAAFTVARWGGEEFLVVMPDTLLADAAGWMARARADLRERPWPDGPIGLEVDFSAGVCEHRGENTVATTLAHADQALYRAKAQGRGRIVHQPADG